MNLRGDPSTPLRCAQDDSWGYVFLSPGVLGSERRNTVHEASLSRGGSLFDVPTRYRRLLHRVSRYFTKT